MAAGKRTMTDETSILDAAFSRVTGFEMGPTARDLATILRLIAKNR